MPRHGFRSQAAEAAANMRHARAESWSGPVACRVPLGMGEAVTDWFSCAGVRSRERAR